jgi:hypothetical protein
MLSIFRAGRWAGSWSGISTCRLTCPVRKVLTCSRVACRRIRIAVGRTVVFLVDSSDTKRFWVRRWKNVRVRHNEISSQSIFPYVFCDIFIGESCAYIWLDDFGLDTPSSAVVYIFSFSRWILLCAGSSNSGWGRIWFLCVFVRLCAWRTGWIDGLRPPREHPAVLWGRYFNEFHFILSVRRPFNILYWLYSFELFIYVILFF